MIPRFNERADTYRESAVVQRELAAWLAEWLEPAEQLAGLTALELGAGDGLFTALLASRVRRLTAIDAAPRMVARGAEHVPQIAWRTGNAWQLADEQVDRLYSASLLQWCDRPQATLRRWQRLVKPGGRMLHGFYIAPTLAEFESLTGAPPAVAWRSGDQWLEALRAAGWEVIRSESQTRLFRFSSALELLRFFHRTGAAMPRGIGPGALRRLLAEYDRRFAHALGGVGSTWTFFRVEVARKTGS